MRIIVLWDYSVFLYSSFPSYLYLQWRITIGTQDLHTRIFLPNLRTSEYTMVHPSFIKSCHHQQVVQDHTTTCIYHYVVVGHGRQAYRPEIYTHIATWQDPFWIGPSAIFLNHTNNCSLGLIWVVCWTYYANTPDSFRRSRLIQTNNFQSEWPS